MNVEEADRINKLTEQERKEAIDYLIVSGEAFEESEVEILNIESRVNYKRRIRHPINPKPPFRRLTPKMGRNELCPCGGGKKYKNCCRIKEVER